MKSQLMQVFSAAFEEFVKQEDEHGNNRYERLFERYFGERWPAPAIAEENEQPWPSFQDLENANSPIVNECVRIGTYDHTPYCYMLEDGSWTGWEYEIAEGVREIIFDRYKELGSLKFEWVAAPIDESMLPMDGSDNTDIKDFLLSGLRKGHYHMVFSGTLIKYEAGVDPDYEFAHPTSDFFVSGVYTGRGEFGEIPIDSAEAMLQALAKASTPEKPLRIIHTANGGQTNIAANIGNWITQKYGGYVTDWDIFIPSLFPMIEMGDPHIYVGDALQIMVMTTIPETFPNIQNLKLNFDAFTTYSAEASSPNSVSADPMKIAPFSLIDRK